eukprot:580180-Pleurochrysis_carterae.AAC.1
MDAGVLVPLFDKLDQPVDHLLAREEQGREARAQIECEDGLHPVEQAMCVLRRRLGAQRARLKGEDHTSRIRHAVHQRAHEKRNMSGSRERNCPRK